MGRRLPADDGAPARARLHRAADPRRQRPHLLPRDPGQGDHAGRTFPSTSSPPSVSGPGFTGQALTCATGTWQKATETWVTWYRSNKIGPEHPRYRAPSQFDLGNFTTPAEPEFGTAPLPWTDSLLIGEGATYVPTAADVGKVIHCTVSADNGGATVLRTAAAPGDPHRGERGRPGRRDRAGDALAQARPAGRVRAVHPGRRERVRGDHERRGHLDGRRRRAVGQRRSSTAPGRLVNGAFALAQPLQVRASSAAGAGQAFAPLSANAPLTVLTYAGPTSNDAGDAGVQPGDRRLGPLRTGAYSKTLTFTLSTTTP